MTRLGYGEVFLFAEIIEGSFKPFYLFKASSNSFGLITAEGVHNNNFVHKIKAFQEVFQYFRFIQRDG